MRQKKEIKNRMVPHFLWIGLFGVWLTFLSGVFSSFTHSPGLLDAFRLKNLLEQKGRTLKKNESQIEELTAARDLLKNDSRTIEKEIRRILGYTQPNEIVFDFYSTP